MSLKEGDTIALLRKGQVEEKGDSGRNSELDAIGYKFVLSESAAGKRPPPPVEDDSQKRAKNAAEDDEMLCGLCKKVMFQPVTVAPCLHSVRGCYGCAGSFAGRATATASPIRRRNVRGAGKR